MASGHRHDQATLLLALPFALAGWPLLGPAAVPVVAVAFLLGGLWLSPDLDIHSRATGRWGPLRLLWWPYRRLIPHRSPLSHSPFLGTAGRLAYLAALILLPAALLQPLGMPGPGSLLALAGGVWRSQRPLAVAALVAVEASCWLHLLLDGDPLPRLPRRRRARSRARMRG